MRAVFPFWLNVSAEPQPRFVDQGRRLQRLSRGFAGHLRGGELAQFAIDHREDFIRHQHVAVFGALEQKSEIAGSWFGRPGRVAHARKQ